MSTCHVLKESLGREACPKTIQDSRTSVTPSKHHRISFPIGHLSCLIFATWLLAASHCARHRKWMPPLPWLYRSPSATPTSPNIRYDRDHRYQRWAEHSLANISRNCSFIRQRADFRTIDEIHWVRSRPSIEMWRFIAAVCILHLELGYHRARISKTRNHSIDSFSP